MAEALEETIPCDRCNTQISMLDWGSHQRQCLHGESKPEKSSNYNTTNGSSTESIPCEYCDAQIPLDDWQTHSKQCADAHKRPVENVKRETDTESIPCEFCDSQINLSDWESHTAKCRNRNGRGATGMNKYSDEPIDAVIPCEYCGEQVSIHDLAWHTNKCAETERKRIQNKAKQIANEKENNTIPCEYCDKPIELDLFQAHQTECRRKQNGGGFQGNVSHEQIFGGVFPLPKYWDQSSLQNLSRHILQPDSDEYRFVAENFHKTLPSNQIIQIERIQNRRWYRQYDAHRDAFIEKYDKSTEQWLFHGCKAQSVDAIINDCFNRSHAVRCAAGQGIYFAAQAKTSLGYTQPDANNERHMFMARVLVGKTTGGNQQTRVCPPDYDTTGGGTVFVTYHDAQAYGEYLITFR